jgi:hypothetical protein
VDFNPIIIVGQNGAYYSAENPVNINLVTILAWDRISQNLSYGIFDKSGDIYEFRAQSTSSQKPNFAWFDLYGRRRARDIY